VSRLIIDCNRPPDSASLIVVESEDRPVRANRNLRPEERLRRLESIHKPYHAAIDACLARRRDARFATALIAVHSFAPVYFGKVRPWQIGIVVGEDRRLSDLLLSKLRSDAKLTVGHNEPYSPADQVYYTIARHAGAHGVPATMIEIRNDEIADEAGRQRRADRLADILLAAVPALFGPAHEMRCENCMS
jgi:predicted N-formylglutamate amidohydrolase